MAELPIDLLGVVLLGHIVLSGGLYVVEAQFPQIRRITLLFVDLYIEILIRLERGRLRIRELREAKATAGQKRNGQKCTPRDAKRGRCKKR